MASIRPESAGTRSDFITKVVLGFLTLTVTPHLIIALGLNQIDVPSYVSLPAFLIANVVMYGMLHGLMSAVFFAASLLTQAAQVLAGYVEEIVEHSLTWLIECSGQLAIRLIALSFQLLWLGGAWLHSRTLEPLLERKRQRDELRQLYEEVKSEYASFEEFLRDFNAGFEEAEKRKAKDRSDQQERERRNAREAQRDPFKDACAVFGLPEDGNFTEADLKQRYGKLIRSVHPDIVGPNAIAAQVNQARDTIKKRKGW